MEEKPVRNPLSQFLHDETQIHDSHKDELLDIHIGNPLRKITALLEEIKRQKAFSLDLKGSLGLAGIALTLGVFGIFGGTKALCSKGVQTKIGQIHTLKYQQDSEASVLSKIPILNLLITKPKTNRLVLVDKNGLAYNLLFKNNFQPILPSSSLENFVTGEYDSCSQTVSAEQPASIESY
jgi:hypothetical protein